MWVHEFDQIPLTPTSEDWILPASQFFCTAGACAQLICGVDRNEGVVQTSRVVLKLNCGGRLVCRVVSKIKHLKMEESDEYANGTRTKIQLS